jgi:hypothetical protein
MREETIGERRRSGLRGSRSRSHFEISGDAMLCPPARRLNRFVQASFSQSLGRFSPSYTRNFRRGNPLFEDERFIHLERVSLVFLGCNVNTTEAEMCSGRFSGNVYCNYTKEQSLQGLGFFNASP